jgi:hypothetical protein
MRAAEILIGLALLAVPRAANAFCRTTTVSIDPSFDPSKQVSFDDAQTGMLTAFAQWTNATCPTDGGVSSKASIDVRFLGPVACDKVQYNQSGGNANVIMFDDNGWPHNDSNNTLGLTTVTYNVKTGELYDADMEINTSQVTLTVNGDVPQDGYDFLSIVTHESGHFLGMAHSPDEHATMFAHYTQGTTSLRNLSTDDIQGICTIYPPDETRTTGAGPLVETACDPTPRHGYSGSCGGGAMCDVAPGPARGALAGLALGAVGLFAAMRRSKRRT